MTESTIHRAVLPWPDGRLSPNARVHWSTKAAAAFIDRKCGWAAALETNLPRMTGPLDVLVTFCPPDNRRRDADNALASCKALLDGVAQAIGVDDSQWRLSLAWGPVVKGGQVVLTFGWAAVPLRGSVGP